jgi:hypothetical protein
VVYGSLHELDNPDFFLWIDAVKQGDAPLRAEPLRIRFEKWLAADGILVTDFVRLPFNAAPNTSLIRSSRGLRRLRRRPVGPSPPRAGRDWS